MQFEATWMNLEIIILSKVSQRIITYITYMWNLKNYTNELIYKTERLTDIENKIMVTKGERGVINWKFEFNLYTLL